MSHKFKWDFDPHTILGLDPSKNYSARQIKDAYSKKCKNFPPDRNENPDSKRMSEKIEKAKEVLSNTDLSQIFNANKAKLGLRRAWAETLNALGEGNLIGNISSDEDLLDLESNNFLQPKEPRAHFSGNMSPGLKRRNNNFAQRAPCTGNLSSEDDIVVIEDGSSSYANGQKGHKFTERKKTKNKTMTNSNNESGRGMAEPTEIMKFKKRIQKLQQELDSERREHVVAKAQLECSDDKVKTLRKDVSDLKKKIEKLEKIGDEALDFKQKNKEVAKSTLKDSRSDAVNAREDRKEAAELLELVKKMYESAKRYNKEAKDEYVSALKAQKKAEFDGTGEGFNRANSNRWSGAKKKRAAVISSDSDAESASDDGHKKHKCEECGKLFASKTNLSRHGSCHEAQPFPCPICGKLLSRSDVLKVHVATQHPD